MKSTVMPLALANFVTSALKPGSVSGPRPYITEIVDLPAPLAAAPLLFAFSDGDAVRQPEASPATPNPAMAVRVVLRLIISASP